MMLMWYMILMVTMVLTIAGFLYLGNRVGKFSIIRKLSYSGPKLKINAGYLVVSACFVGLWLTVNLMNAVVCLFYFAMFWLLCDLFFMLVQRFCKHKFKIYYAGIFAIAISVFSLTLGWYQNHHIWQTDYTVTTPKNIPDLKIAFFADSHIGTTFDGKGFARHIAQMQTARPDAVFIVGDFVDDNTTRENMVQATAALKDLHAPLGVYFVFGNHDKGYYGAAHRGFSSADLLNELRKSNVIILQDDILPFKEMFYIIGRQDSSERERGGNRLPMDQLVKGLDQDKFIIVLDHQPNDYANQKATGVDLVLSGHTHGGQLWPLNKVGEWIGANDKTYGYEMQDKTNFIVTSGLSDWAIKFKTGTKSEFVVVDIQKTASQ